MGSLLLLKVGGPTASGASVKQVSSLAAANNAAGPQTITFGSALTTGSTIILVAAVGSDNGGISHPNQVITSITATNVTWGREDTGRLSTTKNGVDIWKGSVTTGGATSITVNHTSNSHIAVSAIEITPTVTKNGAVTANSYFNDTTHDMGTKTISGSNPQGVVVAGFWGDPWGFGGAGNPTYTDPSGWTRANSRASSGDSKPAYWMGYLVLDGNTTSVNPTLTLSVGSTNGQVSLLTAYTI